MSYVSQQFLLADCSSLTNFKSWAQAISNAFSTSGWTQSSDTGQVNWSTIASIPASGSYVYEIWQPGDALQTGSTKLFLKIEYGQSGSGAGSGPRIRISTSTSTDGSGNLNGISTALQEITANGGISGQGSVLTFDCYFSGDVDRFGMALWRSLGVPCPIVVAIERTKNTDGTNSSDGYSLYMSNNTGSNFIVNVQQTVVFGVALANNPASRSFLALYNNQSSSDSFNNNICVSPVFPQYGKIGNPNTVIGFVKNSDVADGCEFTTSLYGATRTYLALTTVITFPGNMRICLRFD